jgi:hypothetical protein
MESLILEVLAFCSKDMTQYETLYIDVKNLNKKHIEIASYLSKKEKRYFKNYYGYIIQNN